MGSRYQLKWVLQLSNGKNNYYFESFLVLPPTQVAVLGVEDIVEIWGEIATVGITLPKAYDHVTYIIYKDNDKVGDAVDADNLADPDAAPEGYVYTGSFDSNLVKARLEPYTIVWSYWDDAAPTRKSQDSGSLFFTTPSIMSAAKDVVSIVNKAYVNLGIIPDAEYSIPGVLTYLRLGMDYFNAIDFITQFNMTKASGAVRSMWIKAACAVALRAQYLAEGEKTFNFSSQAVTLDIDKTSYFESLASVIESELQQFVPKFKQQLTRNGIVGGNGDLANTKLPRFGSTGALAISITPASNSGALQRAGIPFPGS